MRDIPGLRIAGTHHGYFEQSDTASIVEAINESGAGFLCVALGFPKQERFLLENKNALHIKAGIGIGGSFDVWAGALKRAPKVFRSFGLEWLYRLGQEPSRIKRIATLPLFLVRVAAQKVSGA
jgi:N-acetylglucosaminyldiphosphoundecaprenol N-acetyl-beta-D-mannosaminyltransferase